MTERRDLKDRIRDRQEKTGERYTTARAHVLAEKEPPDWVLELHDIRERARAEGLTGGVSVSPGIWKLKKDLDKLLAHLRRILAGPLEGMEPLRRALLRGEPNPPPDQVALVGSIEDMHRFFIGLEQGLRGPSLGGHLLTFITELGGRSRTVVVQLLPRATEVPSVVLSLYPDEDIPFMVRQR